MSIATEHGASALTRYVYDQILAKRRDVLERLAHEDFRLGGTREHVGRTEWLDIVLGANLEAIDIQDVEAREVAGNAVVTSALATLRAAMSAARSKEPGSSSMSGNAPAPTGS